MTANQSAQLVMVGLVDAAVVDARGERLLQGDGCASIVADQIKWLRIAAVQTPVVSLVVVTIVRFELGKLARITIEQGQVIQPVAQGLARFSLVVPGHGLPAERLAQQLLAGVYGWRAVKSQTGAQSQCGQ
ncbi:hypothetical protein AERO9A_140156 [Aeromonas salmonicida]|nr:hypothetical protein AERO9A_140156 [Aeromonas salmonicida]